MQRIQQNEETPTIAQSTTDVVNDLPRSSSLQLGIEISGKTMGARGLMGMR